MNKKNGFLLLLSITVVMLSSCIGVSLDIQMNRDGSGRLTMLYNISNTLLEYGGIDGISSESAVPLSRSDWERTAERNKDIKLVSYSSKQSGQNTIITIVADFTNLEALREVLDPSIDNIIFSLNDQGGNLNILLSGDSGSMDNYDENVLEIVKYMFEDYNFSFSFSAPGNSAMRITNGNGEAISLPTSAAAVLTGRKVSLTMNILDSLFTEEGLRLLINW